MRELACLFCGAGLLGLFALGWSMLRIGHQADEANDAAARRLEQ